MPRSFDLHALRPAGFSLQPLATADEGCWWQGTHAGSGRGVIVRVAPSVPFAEAVVEAAGLIDLMDSSTAGVASPLAVVVYCRDGRPAAATAAAAAGFTVVADPAVAAALAADEPVDVCAIYDAAGAAALDAANDAPQAAAERLAAVADVLDGLAAGRASCGGRRLVAHGAIDAPCLRIGPDGPALLGLGFDRLDGGRRSRLDAVGAWRLAAPETCLPPGEPGSRTDQYMLAAAWAWSRRNRPLHDGIDPVGIARTILSTAPSLDDLPEAERAAVARALAIAADERFASCREFAAAVRESVADRVAVATSATVGAGAAAAPSMPVATEDDTPARAAPAAPLAAASVRPTAPVTDTTPAPDEIVIAERHASAVELRPSESDPVAATPPTPPPPPAAQPSAPPRAEAPPRAQAPPNVPPPTAVALPPAMPAVAAERSTAGPSAPAARLASGPYKPGDMILPGYRLVGQLGKGGFGEVWKATAPGGMGVAIKVISNLGRREGAREYRALRTVKDIRHAHIVPMFGVWLKTSDGRLLDEDEAAKVGGRMLNTDPGQRVTLDPQTASPLEQLELVIAMGLGDQTLFDRLRSEPEGLDVGEVLVWLRQAALAIDHFNRGSAGVERTQSAVQHCDIKPQNMLLVGNVVQVCDFGLARVQGEVRATANNLLSIAYAAPEMTQRPYDPSPATDQYSLAVTYHELRTARLPYAGPAGESATGELSALELLRAKAEGRLDLSAVSPGEERVLRRALSTDPTDRFGSCEEFIDALDFAVERANANDQGAGEPAAASFPWLKAALLGAGSLVALGLAAVLFLPGFWPFESRRDGDGRGLDTGNGRTQQAVTVPPVQEPPPDFLAKARAAIEAAGGGEALVDPARLQEARQWAEKARQGGDEAAAARLIAELDAVEKIAAIVRGATTDESRLDEAAESVRTLPAGTPPQVRTSIENALRGQLDRRATAAVERARDALLAAVAPAGDIDAQRLDAALKEADRARTLAGDATTKPLFDAVAAVRTMAPVILSTAAEPAGLDDAVSAMDRATTSLPEVVRERLGRRLADRLVARARQRLKDYEPKASPTPPDAMRRAIDDSAADAAAAARIDPASWQARREQGRCAAFLGQYEAAAKHYSAALDLATAAGTVADADRQDLHSRRAFALLKESRFADAADDYVVFRAGDPKLRLNLWDLHLSAVDAGKVDEALKILAVLEPRMRGDVAPLPQLALWEVLSQEAWLLACGPRADEASGRRAIALATEALELPGAVRGTVLDALAAGHARAGQWDDAVERLKQAVEATDDADDKKSLERRAEAYARRQPWSKVVDDPAGN